PGAGPAQRLRHDVGGEARVPVLDDGQAHAVDRDRSAVLGIRGRERPGDSQARRVGTGLEGDDTPQLLDDSGEHQSVLPRVAVIRTSWPITVMSVGSSLSAWSIVVIPRSPTL